MLFFAARVIREAAMQNPTLVVLTDRNDLDDQLFGQFQRCADILGQTPVQAASRDKLRELLAVASGGVVFTTIQKFLPPGTGSSGRESAQTSSGKDQSRLTSAATNGGKLPPLSERWNIIVIADEAHRSQYGLIDGLTQHMRDGCPTRLSSASTARPSRRRMPTRGRSGKRRMTNSEGRTDDSTPHPGPLPGRGGEGAFAIRTASFALPRAR